MLSRQDGIIAFAEKVAKHWFLAMMNPSYRGPNFYFDKFDIEDHVEASADFHFIKPLNKREKELLRSQARFNWESCIKLTDVLNVDIKLKEKDNGA